MVKKKEDEMVVVICKMALVISSRCLPTKLPTTQPLRREAVVLICERNRLLSLLSVALASCTLGSNFERRSWLAASTRQSFMGSRRKETLDRELRKLLWSDGFFLLLLVSVVMMIMIAIASENYVMVVSV